MRWLGGLHLRGDAALFRARLCRLWVAAAHSERQWAALCGTTGAGLSRLSVWWIRLGITPVRIVPGHPEQNGSHEQFHAVLKAATARPPAATCRAQQRRFDRVRREYNHERPHEALADRVPADLYQASGPVAARAPAAARVSRPLRGAARLQ